mmetsp:Transcript_14427/g.42598  ORF Transcript_14427/g.42598 Transcript_14427/m.42598 type:complete len:336 (-) Transcript_14427:351-1358(-)
MACPKYNSCCSGLLSLCRRTSGSGSRGLCRISRCGGTSSPGPRCFHHFGNFHHSPLFQRQFSSDAHGHGVRAILSRDDGWFAGLCRFDKILELKERGALVKAGFKEFFINAYFLHSGVFLVLIRQWRNPRIGRFISRCPLGGVVQRDCAGGCLSRDLALGPHDKDLFMLPVFSEHAQIKTSADAGSKVDDGIGVVHDVRCAHLALHGILLMLVVDVHSTACKHALGNVCAVADDASHQIPEVAAFFHQSPSRELGESVPVRHLEEEGEAMLANVDHDKAADCAAVRVLEEPSDRRHVAVFHAHPEHESLLRWHVLLDEFLHLKRVLHRGAHWLLH